MKRECKECGKPVARGNKLVSYAARKLGYCKYCYEMNFPENHGLGRRVHKRSEYVTPMQSSDVFDPDSPWEWYEYFFPERDR
jgi:hypothetical protein